jgi:hypothetical protein
MKDKIKIKSRKSRSDSLFFSIAFSKTIEKVTDPPKLVDRVESFVITNHLSFEYDA